MFSKTGSTHHHDKLLVPVTCITYGRLARENNGIYICSDFENSDVRKGTA